MLFEKVGIKIFVVNVVNVKKKKEEKLLAYLKTHIFIKNS